MVDVPLIDDSWMRQCDVELSLNHSCNIPMPQQPNGGHVKFRDAENVASVAKISDEHER